MAVDLFVGEVQLVKAGAPVPGSREAAEPVMKEQEITFVADLHVGGCGRDGLGLRSHRGVRGREQRLHNLRTT